MAGKTMVQFGSQGDEVKELQELLNNRGANLVVDGVFGAKTKQAVYDFQLRNQLGVDGIVGNETWQNLLGNNTSTESSIPNAPTYDTSTWDESSKGSAAGSAYEAAKDAVNNYGDFVFSEQEWLDSLKNDINNYGEFSYDVNSDALYQQYADQYIRQGKLASADVMGQAAALTGGYGNSYMATVGNQAYQSYLQQLNDKVPELHQLALERYNMGKEDLYNKYGMLLEEYKREYGEYSDEYQKLIDALGIAEDAYYNGADMFYTEQDNNNGVLGQEFNDAMSIWEAINDNAWREKEYNLNERQVALEESKYNKSTNNNNPSEESTSDKYKEPTFTGKSYDEAVAFLKANGVADGGARIMTSGEWSRRRVSYTNNGTGGAEVANYSSYKDYLADIVAYLIEESK